MRSEQTGRTRRPVAVNEEFFANLSALLADMRARALQAICERLDEPLSKVKAIANRQHEVPEVGACDYSDPEKFKEQLELMNEQHLVERVLLEVRDETGVSFHLNYVDGYSVQTESLAALKDVLNREPGRPRWPAVRVGGCRGPRLALNLFNSTTGTILRGQRRPPRHRSPLPQAQRPSEGFRA